MIIRKLSCLCLHQAFNSTELRGCNPSLRGRPHEDGPDRSLPQGETTHQDCQSAYECYQCHKDRMSKLPHSLQT